MITYAHTKRQSSRSICGIGRNCRSSCTIIFPTWGEGYVTARNPDAVKALVDEIKANGGHAEAAKVDALNETEIDDFLNKVIADNGKLDVVFNGIGVEYSEMGGRPLTTVATFAQFMAPMRKDLRLAISYFKGSSKVYDTNRSEGYNLTSNGCTYPGPSLLMWQALLLPVQLLKGLTRLWPLNGGIV